MVERSEYMLSIAEKSLADVALTETDKPGFRRFIRRVPLGVVLVIAPWKWVSLFISPPSPPYLITLTTDGSPVGHMCSFPYLVSINSVLPAIISGNAVLLKPSPQTPLTAERFALALTRAGVPKDIIQAIHLSPELTTFATQHKLVNFVSFTGSVAGGKAVETAAVSAPGFKGVALEVSIICILFYNYLTGASLAWW